MDERIKNIYKLMFGYEDYKMEQWYRPMLQRIQRQIDLRTSDKQNSIQRWEWYRSCDGIWQNWTGDYFKEITRISKKMKELKADLKKYMKDERAMKDASDAISMAFKDPFEGKNVVPFRDRKHTKGVFRRADNNDDESGDE